MTRIIRPIGKVSAALKRHGYRQQAVIIVDGKQLPHVAVLSVKVGDKLKFEGHYIDPNGELHKTNSFVDMKRAATRILAIREQVLADIPTTKPASAKKPAAVKPSAPRKRRPKLKPIIEPVGDEGSKLIDCPGCGFLHRDDAMCV